MNDRAPPLMTLADFIVDSRLIAEFAEGNDDADSFGLLSCSDGDMKSFRLPILRLLTCNKPLKLQVPHKHGFYAVFCWVGYSSLKQMSPIFSFELCEKEPPLSAARRESEKLPLLGNYFFLHFISRTVA